MLTNSITTCFSFSKQHCHFPDEVSISVQGSHWKSLLMEKIQGRTRLHCAFTCHHLHKKYLLESLRPVKKCNPVSKTTASVGWEKSWLWEKNSVSIDTSVLVLTSEVTQPLSRYTVSQNWKHQAKWLRINLPYSFYCVNFISCSLAHTENVWCNRPWNIDKTTWFFFVDTNIFSCY